MRGTLILLATALGLAGCAGGGAYYGGYGYYDDPFYDPWDYGFRYGVYDAHEDIDVDVFRRLLLERLRAFAPTSPEVPRLTS